MDDSDLKNADWQQVRGELRHLRHIVKQQGYTLAKWGRMLNALVAVLDEKGILTKQDIMLAVYERLRGSGAMERKEQQGAGEWPHGT